MVKLLIRFKYNINVSNDQAHVYDRAYLPLALMQ